MTPGRDFGPLQLSLNRRITCNANCPGVFYRELRKVRKRYKHIFFTDIKGNQQGNILVLDHLNSEVLKVTVLAEC